jgi:hypothetical protein
MTALLLAPMGAKSNTTTTKQPSNKMTRNEKCERFWTLPLPTNLRADHHLIIGEAAAICLERIVAVSVEPSASLDALLAAFQRLFAHEAKHHPSYDWPGVKSIRCYAHRHEDGPHTFRLSYRVRVFVERRWSAQIAARVSQDSSWLSYRIRFHCRNDDNSECRHVPGCPMVAGRNSNSAFSRRFVVLEIDFRSNQLLRGNSPGFRCYSLRTSGRITE